MLERGVRATLYSLGIPLVLLGLWCACKIIFQPEDYILPWPGAVVEALAKPTNAMIDQTIITLGESSLGFLVGNLMAGPFALLFQFSELSRKLLMPLAIGLKTTPIVAIAPLLLIWFGPGLHTKVIASALICFFPMLVNLYESMAQAPRPLEDYLESLGATRGEKIIRLRLMYAVPEAFAALRVSSTLAVVGAVVGEMVSATSGLGHVIIASSYSFETDLTYAAILMTCCCGGLLFGVVAIIEHILGIAQWRN